MKKNIALLALGAASLLGLGSCVSGPVASTGGNDSSASSDSTHWIDAESVRFALTVNAPEGVTVTVDGLAEDKKVQAGAAVTFAVSEELPLQEVKTVKADGALLAEKDGKYGFTMPSHAVTIEVELRTLGDESVLEVSDVDETTIPTLAADKYQDVDSIKAFVGAVKNLLLLSDSAQTAYLREIHFEGQDDPLGSGVFKNEFDFSTYSAKPASGTLKASADAIALVARTEKDNSSSDSTISAERGFYGEKNFFTHKRQYKTTVNSKGGVDLSPSSDEYNLRTVVPNDTETLDSYSIKEADARAAATTFKIGEAYASTVFETASGATSTSLGYFGYGGKLYNTIRSVETKVAEDKKSYELKIVSSDLSVADLPKVYENVMVFDGDNFLREMRIDVREYGAGDIDADTGLAKEGIEASGHDYFHLEETRGFKYAALDLPPLEEYAPTDFDVEFSYTRSWADKTRFTSDVESLTLEKSAKIGDPYLRLKEERNTPVLAPRYYIEDASLVSVGSGASVTLEKTGQTNLVIDNWFGVTKKIPLTIVDPKPYMIDATLSASVVEVGEALTLNARVIPDAATQDVTVALAQDDATGSTLAEGTSNDGKKVWTITPTKAGSSSVTVTSVEDPSIAKTLLFSVAGPATYEGLMSYLPTVTLVNKDTTNTWMDYLYINFNADGTGQFTAVYQKTAKGVVSFLWTLDESTLEFTIKPAEGQSSVSSDSNKFNGFKALNSASFVLIGGYGGYGSSEASHEIAVYAGPRIANFNTATGNDWFTV